MSVIIDGTAGITNTGAEVVTGNVTAASFIGSGASLTGLPSGQIQTQLFTAPGTWTKPSTVTQVRVHVVGGGGGGAGNSSSASGGNGGYTVAICPVSAPISITVGTGGAGGTGPAIAPGSSGNTSSFGSLVSCTGGAGGTYPATAGTPGAATITTGTAITTAALAGNGDSLISGGAGGGSGQPAITYTVPGVVQAGFKGGTGGSPSPGFGGVGGAVVVEFVG